MNGRNGFINFKDVNSSIFEQNPGIVPEESPMIVLYNKSSMCVANNGKDTKHTRHIVRRIHLVRNSEKYKMQNIDCYEGGLKLADIATNNVGEHDLTLRKKYIMLQIDNETEHFYKRGNTIYYSLCRNSSV